MKIGTEDKKKVIIAAVMFAIIVPAAIWEGYGYFSTPTPAPRPPAAVAPAPRAPVEHTNPAPAPVPNAPAAPEAQRVGGIVIDPTLHLDKLAQSEDVEYEGTGRNIFSAESAPVHIEEAQASARPNNPNVFVPPPQEVPKAPNIDIKYFGYEEAKDKSIKAFLIHGEDIFMARPGDVVDHRYKVGMITRGSIQITDLSYNNMQTLPMSPE